MKTIITIAIFGLCVIQTSQGQNDSVTIRKFYHTWVSPDFRTKDIYGSLFEVKDSSILIANTVKRDILLSGNFTVSEIFSDKISMIELKKSGNKSVGMTIGALTGLGAGLITDVVLIRNNHGSDTGVKEFDELGNAISVTALILIPIATTATGLLIGHLIDAGFKKRRFIKEDQSRFEASRSWLSEYSLKHLVNGRLKPLGVMKRLNGTVTDYDGNVYNLLALGGQVWLAENLKTTHYRNGDTIPNVTGRMDWSNLSIGAYCNVRNNPDYYGKFGRLYNRYAVEDSRKICPAGYHVPTYNEWASLILCMGGDENAGDGLKGSGTGMVFASLGGSRDNKGAFTGTGESGHYWWSKPSDTEIMIGFSIKRNAGKVEYIRMDAGENSGMSVRCLRDN